MTDASKIEKFKRCEMKAYYNGMDIQLMVEKFYIQKYGAFYTVDELYAFLCGFDAGREQGASVGDKGEK